MMLQHSLGFSGVIFQLSVMESNLSPSRTRSVFGVLQVSSLGGDIEIFNNVIMGGGNVVSDISTRKNLSPLSFVGFIHLLCLT